MDSEKTISTDDLLNEDGTVKDSWKFLYEQTYFASEEEARAAGLATEDGVNYFYRDYEDRKIPMICHVEISPTAFTVKPVGALINSKWGNVLFDIAAQMGIWIDINDEASEYNWKDLVVEAGKEILDKDGLSFGDAVLLPISGFINIDAQVCYDNGLIEGIYAFLNEWFNPVQNEIKFNDKLYTPGNNYIYTPNIKLYNNYVDLLVQELENHFPSITGVLTMPGPHGTNTRVQDDSYSALKYTLKWRMNESRTSQQYDLTQILNSGKFNIQFKGKVKWEYRNDRFGYYLYNDWKVFVYKQRDNEYITITNSTDTEGHTINVINYPSDWRVSFDCTVVTPSTEPRNPGYNTVFGDYSHTNLDVVNRGGFQYDVESGEVVISLMNFEGEAKPYTLTKAGVPSGKGVNVDFPDWPEDRPTPRRNPEDEPQEPIDDYDPVIDPVVIEVPNPVPVPPEDIDDPTPEEVEPVETEEVVNDDAFVNIYNPTSLQLKNINDVLWSDNAIADLKKWWTNNPIDGIVSVHKVFIDIPLGNTKPFVVGRWNSDLQTPVTNRYHTLNFNYLIFERPFNDFRDFDITAQIYLPCIGLRPIDINDLISINGNTLVYLEYRVDVCTGDFVALISIKKAGEVNKVCKYSFDGNMKADYPISSATKQGVVNGLISTATGLISGNVASAAMGLVSTVTNQGTQISKSGTVGSSLAPLGVLYPYIILEKPLPYANPEHDNIVGRTTNEAKLVRSMTGTTSYKDIHVDIARASDTENNQIHQYLLDGIIV